jgi:hypothetical protein
MNNKRNQFIAYLTIYKDNDGYENDERFHFETSPITYQPTSYKKLYYFSGKINFYEQKDNFHQFTI